MASMITDVCTYGEDGKQLQSYVNFSHMHKRVYSKKYHRSYLYSDVTISEDWHVYSKFKEWHDKNYTDGFVLDKDLSNSREYSSDNCHYISKKLNNFLQTFNYDGRLENSSGCAGVSYEKSTGMYRACISDYFNKGKRIQSIRFYTYNEAVKARKDLHVKLAIKVLEDIAMDHSTDVVILFKRKIEELINFGYKDCFE